MVRRVHWIAMLGLSLLMYQQTGAFQKSNGTPLGGMGTGYVKFNARTGEFGVSGKTPPAAADGNEFTSRKPSSAGFYFYADGKTMAKAKTDNEEARCPLYTADFGKTGGVTFILNAFGPLVPGDNAENYKLVTSPMALFDISAINGNSEAVEIGAALEFANGGLLGGANSGTAETGNRAISFSGTENAYLAVDCDGTSPGFSVGSITTSFNGTLPNSSGNAVASKCTIAPGDTVHFKFVLSWWRKYENTSSKYGVAGGDKENYWYHNNFSSSKEVAEYGITKFDYVRDGVISYVNRVMASNFPAWYNERLLNNTYPLIHNSQWAKDGRVAFWEGKYGIIGTIDQGEHAAVFYTFKWPHSQWQELQYWGRTSWQGDIKGQVHHDFNQGIQTFSGAGKDRFMCPWDQWDRPDYWWVPDTKHWSDLNSMFIFKAYELMLATGNKDSLRTYFPYIKNTANRLIQQSTEASKSIPENSESTYDEPGVKTPQYACGIALTAYLAVVEIAKFLGEDAVAAQFRTQYEKGRKEYRTDLYNTSFGTGKDISEGDLAGYSWAHYFGFEPVMDSDFVATAVKRCDTYYGGMSDLRARLGRWHFYAYDHFAGAALSIGETDIGMKVHKWDYDFYYTGNPGYVFWQTLQKTNSEYASYMTAPCVWRSYHQMTGYLIDNANKRLWIRPSIPTDMNKKITDAMLPNPYGMGTLSYDETADPASPKRTQIMTISYDTPVSVKEIILKNNTGKTEGIYVQLVNAGTPVDGVSYKAEGTGFDKRIRVTLAQPISIQQGLQVAVYKDTTVAVQYRSNTAIASALKTRSLESGKPVSFVTSRDGFVTLEAYGLNGARIGTLLSSNVSAGEHNIVWNGKTTNGYLLSTRTVVVKLRTPDAILTRQMQVIR